MISDVLESSVLSSPQLPSPAWADRRDLSSTDKNPEPHDNAVRASPQDRRVDFRFDKLCSRACDDRCARKWRHVLSQATNAHSRHRAQYRDRWLLLPAGRLFSWLERL